VFPSGAGRAAEEIKGTGLEHERKPFPRCARFATKTEPTRGAERDADDIFENGLVAVPADRGARSVFGYQNVREGVGWQFSEGGRFCSYRFQDIRDIFNSIERE